MFIGAEEADEVIAPTSIPEKATKNLCQWGPIERCKSYLDDFLAEVSEDGCKIHMLVCYNQMQIKISLPRGKSSYRSRQRHRNLGTVG